MDVLYSVVRGSAPVAGRRSFHLLYLDTTLVARSMDWQEVLDPAVFAGYGWRTLEDERVQLLLDPTTPNDSPPAAASEAGDAPQVDGWTASGAVPPPPSPPRYERPPA